MVARAAHQKRGKLGCELGIQDRLHQGSGQVPASLQPCLGAAPALPQEGALQHLQGHLVLGRRLTEAYASSKVRLCSGLRCCRLRCSLAAVDLPCITGQ